jgi:hypothetical protein
MDRKVIIEKVPEDRPLTLMRKSAEAKRRQRQEKVWLDKQERQFVKLTGIEVSVQEYWEIQEKRFALGRMGKSM